MKKLLCLLIALLLASAAMADYPDTRSLTFPYEGSPNGSLTLEWYDPPCDAISSSENFIAGLYVEERWAEAWHINLLLAEAGDALSMLRLGHHCLNGLGVPQDEAAAMQWYERAAAGGSSDASRCIALMHFNGWGVPKDAAHAATLLEDLAEQHHFGTLVLAQLYLLGDGNLAPDMDKAMYWFDMTYAFELRQAQGGGEYASSYRDQYEWAKEAFLSVQALPATLIRRPNLIRWNTGAPTAIDAKDMGHFWCDGDGGVVDYVEAARWYEMAIRMDANAAGFAYQSAHYELGNFYREGMLGVINADRAIRCYGHAATYDKIAEMFRSGLTGPDGTVHLAPDAALAEAFSAVDEYREATHVHFRLIGDLFRTGQNPAGERIVTPDHYLAAKCYYMGMNDPYCAAQLTWMYRAGLITDPMLLYLIGKEIPYSDCDVSELILLIAEDLLCGRITIWKPNADYTEARHGQKLLERALSMDKLPDPQAAEALLALVPQNE